MDGTEGSRVLLAEAGKICAFHTSKDDYLRTRALWDEFKVLDRLMYKYHNQQRRDMHFRRLRLLRRRLQRVQKMESWVHWSIVCKNEGDHGKQVEGLGVLLQLLQMARADCMRAYEALHSLLLDVIYVPFAVMSSAAVAKVYVQLDKAMQIARAMQLDLHSQPGVVSDAHVFLPHKDRHPCPPRKDCHQERTEQGWDRSTGHTKKRKFTKRKLKGHGGGDEIDEIFK